MLHTSIIYYVLTPLVIYYIVKSILCFISCNLLYLEGRREVRRVDYEHVDVPHYILSIRFTLLHGLSSSEDIHDAKDCTDNLRSRSAYRCTQSNF